MAPSFCIDANLGLPIDSDTRWQSFLSRHHVDVMAFRGDMAPMAAQLAKGSTTMAHLPAATYFALRDHPGYEPIASAVDAATGRPDFTNLLIVPATSDVDSVADLRGKRLGIAHRYCTSSFLAPAVLLGDRGESIHQFFDRLVIVPPYQGQVDAMLSGTVDATMVEQDVWERTSSNSRTTKVVANVAGLPTPLVIVHRDAGAELRRDLSELLFDYHPTVTPTTQFAGFVPYQQDAMAAFFATAARALG